MCPHCEYISKWLGIPAKCSKCRSMERLPAWARRFMAINNKNVPIVAQKVYQAR
jgi:hypothetical protein